MYEELYKDLRMVYCDLSDTYDELMNDYECLNEEWEQQREVIDSIEDILKKHLPEELAEIIHNEIFQIG